MNSGVALDAALRLAGIPIDGCAILRPERAIEPHWTVINSPTHGRVRLDFRPEATPEQRAQAAAVIESVAADALPAREARIAQAKTGFAAITEFRGRTWPQVASWIDATWPADPLRVIKVMFRLLFYVVKHSDIED